MNGFERLQNVQHAHPYEELDEKQLEPYIQNPEHVHYLHNEQYHRYLKIHKVALSEGGHQALLEIAQSLEQEYMPLYLDASAWSYAELAMFDANRPQEDRLAFLEQAKELWSTGLERQVQLETTPYSVVFDEYDESYRMATSLAFLPLMRVLVNGDVDSTTRNEVLKDVSSIALTVSDDIEKMMEAGYNSNAKQSSGLLHELNALMVLLTIDDPRYVPLPSTARADSGYYYPEQTHDISILNQHWGKIKKVLPVEIKSRPSRKDRLRYNALLIRGRMHLTPDGVDPLKTTHALYSHAQGDPDLGDTLIVERLKNDLRRMLSLYQQGGSSNGIALNSLTKFYSTRNVAKEYPGLAV
jgi:hypothetical protein